MAGSSETRPGPRSRLKLSWVAWLGAGAVLVIFAMRFPGPEHTLQPFYTDHVRHEFASWSFVQIGTSIWSDPLREWDVSARFVHSTWPTVPHVHPPGSVLLFLPFGAAANLGVLPDESVHALLVALLGVGAVAACAALWLALRSTYPLALAVVVTALASVDLIRWGLNGFFDPLAVAVALTGILLLQRGRPGPASLILAVAMSMHFRLWYLLPVVVGALMARRRVDLRAGVVSAVLGVSALPVLFLWPYLDDLPEAPGFAPNVLYGELTAALIAAALISLVAVTERGVVPALATAAASMMILFNPQWQPWYAIVFLPLLPLMRTMPAQVALSVAWVQLALFDPQALELTTLLRSLGEALS